MHFTKWFIDVRGLLQRGATDTRNCGHRWYQRWVKMYRDLESWWNERYPGAKPFLPAL